MIVLLGLVPVVLFLGALVTLDSYKLVPLRSIAAAIVAGVGIAGVCYVLNVLLGVKMTQPADAYSRYLAPLIEEAAKGVYVLWLVRRGRIGFLVDAAIYGFAIGTGFAVAENAYYLHALANPSLTLWLVRGFGTAVMHGGATGILAMSGKALSDREGASRVLPWIAGLAIAITLHSVYNHFFLSPVTSTAMILVLLPPLAALVFRHSEKSLESWLNVGFDSDTEVLESIVSGRLSQSPVGIYLQSLKDRFRGEIIVDMLMYLRLHLELSLRAKGLLMMREAGFDVALDPADHAKLEELDFLEKSIGVTGKLAMAPFLRTSPKDRWQLTLLGRRTGAVGGSR